VGITWGIDTGAFMAWVSHQERKMAQQALRQGTFYVKGAALDMWVRA
jgi:hypothetical protein